MAGSTSGGISDLSLMVGMNVDPSSLTDAMKTLGDVQSKMSSFRAERGIELGSGGGLEQQKAAALFNVKSEEQSRRSNLVAASSKIKAIEAEEAAALAAAARAAAAADTQYEREVKEAVDAYSRIMAERDKAASDAERQSQRAAAAADAQYEREVKEAIDAYSRIMAARDKAEDAAQKEISALRGDLNRANVRVMDTMQRINHEYDERQKRINATTRLTQAETAELHKQNDVIREGNIRVETERGNLAGAGSAGLTGNRIQEIGRGFEDFTVGFSMAKTNIEGVAMGLRGSANNAAQLAASFNPMVGVSVAIGASLATVIVPMVARWLYDTKALEKAQDAWNDKLKESGKRQQEVAEQLGKLMALSDREKDVTKDKKGEATLNEIQSLEEKMLEQEKIAMAKDRELSDAIAAREEARRELKNANAEARNNAAAAIGGGIGMPGGISQRQQGSAKQDEAEAKRAKEEFDLAEERAKTAEKAFSDAEEATSRSEEVISEMRRLKAKEIADYQIEQVDRVRARQLDATKENNQPELEAAKEKADRAYDIEVDKIKKMKILQKDKDSLLERETALRDKRISEANATEEKKVAELSSEIEMETASDLQRKLADIDAKHLKKDEEISKRSLTQEQEDRLRGKNESNRIAQRKRAEEIDRLDAELRENADQQDALKEKIDLQGNGSKSSAAMSVGTQAAESAIAKALSGSQSVEDTDKKQLKVLEKIEKKIGKEKDRTVRL
jgi:hypothetical protein